MAIATSTLNLAQGKLHVAAPYLIEQDWAAYTPEQHAVWSELVTRRMPQLREHACEEYLDGFHQIGLQQDRLPNLREVSARLQPRTGWQSTPVSGFLPPDAFFEMLSSAQHVIRITFNDTDVMLVAIVVIARVKNSGWKVNCACASRVR